MEGRNNVDALAEALAEERGEEVTVAGRVFHLHPASGGDYLALQELLLDTRDSSVASARVPVRAVQITADLEEEQAAALIRLGGGLLGEEAGELLEAAYRLAGLPPRGRVDAEEEEEGAEAADREAEAVKDEGFS